MIMLDEPVSAERALELGLITRIANATDLLDGAQRLAAQVAQMPVGTLGRVKPMMNETFSASLAESANSAEGREGLAAFVAKRLPLFMAD
jgi:2-(1,2-epoxy-1,2-dihydrophenyl)acetyl-CoA isomerase